MAYPTITYNASTGSDTLASGSNAPTTAVTSTSTGITISTNGSTTQTFSSAVNLTGVLDDDSDAIWINTTSGTRHLFRITSFTGGVAACTAIVTTETAGTTQAGLSWAIGGKRQTIQADTSKMDLSDFNSGWTGKFDDGTYNVGTVSTATASGNNADGIISLIATNPGTTAIINLTANISFLYDAYNWLLYGLTFTTSSGTNTTTKVLGSPSNSSSIKMVSCVVDGLAYGIYCPNVNCSVVIDDCVFKNILFSGFYSSNGNSDGLYVTNSYFYNCSTSGNGTNHGCIYYVGGTYDSQPFTVKDCIFYSNTGSAITYQLDTVRAIPVDAAAAVVKISGNIFHTMTKAGIKGTFTSPSNVKSVRITNNIFYNNGTYGQDWNVNPLKTGVVISDYNAYGFNTSGARNNLALGTNDINLYSDPFTNAAGGDFSLNSNPNGGAALKSKAFPLTVRGLTTTTNISIGLAQNPFSTLVPGISGSFWEPQSTSDFASNFIMLAGWKAPNPTGLSFGSPYSYKSTGVASAWWFTARETGILSDFWIYVQNFGGTWSNTDGKINYEIREGISGNYCPYPSLLSSGTITLSGVTGWVAVSGLTVGLSASKMYSLSFNDADGGNTNYATIYTSAGQVGDTPGGLWGICSRTTDGWSTGSLINQSIFGALKIGGKYMGGCPFDAMTTTNSGTYERGVRFRLREPLVLIGVTDDQDTLYSTNDIYKIYADTTAAGGTPLASYTNPGFNKSNATYPLPQKMIFPQTNWVTLEKETWYRCVVKPSTSITTPRKNVTPGTLPDGVRIASFPSNGDCYWTSSETGSWVDEPTNGCIFGPILVPRSQSSYYPTKVTGFMSS